MLYAAIAHARRARKQCHTLWMTLLKWHTTVSIESTVSTTIRTFHVPRLHSFISTGSPSLLWEPESAKTTDSPMGRSISGWKVASCTFAVAPS